MDFVERYGPWAVIAGASEGTGAEFARGLAARGVNCVLVARREGPLSALAEELRATGRIECVTASVDLAAEDAAERLAAAADGKEVGLLVYNAGGDPNGARFLEREAEAWVELARRNVVTAIRACHQFAGPMRRRGRGGLLLVNSGAAYSGADYITTYSGTKAFQLNFAEGLWAELKPHGIDVLTLIMTATDTPAFRTLLAEHGREPPPNIASARDVAELGLEQLPHGPVCNWGQAGDVAGYAPQSADARRERVEKVSAGSRAAIGKG
jgi:short-subunit dehydrogenase